MKLFHFPSDITLSNKLHEPVKRVWRDEGAYHGEYKSPDGVVGQYLLIYHCDGEVREADAARGGPVLVTFGL